MVLNRGPCAFMDDREFDRILQDTRVVRNGAKLATVRVNAGFLMDLRSQGGAGQVLGGWPLRWLHRPSGNAQETRRTPRRQYRPVRHALCSAATVSSSGRDVTARLIAEGVIDKPARVKGSHESRAERLQHLDGAVRAARSPK